jgi:hypothetical protein
MSGQMNNITVAYVYDSVAYATHSSYCRINDNISTRRTKNRTDHCCQMPTITVQDGDKLSSDCQP